MSSTGLKRDVSDKYYTSKEAVDQCILLIKQHLSIDRENDICIEPSAGGGSFIERLQELCENTRFYDIEPHHSDIIKLDYLEFDSDSVLYTQKFDRIHVIGNPPFGRQSSLAIRFIKKSVEYCDSISFILPKSFKKPSLQRHIPIRFHLEAEHDLPENSFMIDNKRHHVPCVFQIWIKKDFDRVIEKKLIPHMYQFVKKEQEHDISFRRVGVNAGCIDRNTHDKSYQSHYFIKFSCMLDDKLYKKLSLINYDGKNDTVGPRSISKQELIKEFNRVLM